MKLIERIELEEKKRRLDLISSDYFCYYIFISKRNFLFSYYYYIRLQLSNTTTNAHI